jgi:hypothetical protein
MLSRVYEGPLHTFHFLLPTAAAVLTTMVPAVDSDADSTYTIRKRFVYKRPAIEEHVLRTLLILRQIWDIIC